MAAYSVITFYRYTSLADAQETCELFRKKCEELCLLGRLLFGDEGLNCGVSGRSQDIVMFKEWVCKKFPGMSFRELSCDAHVYHKLVCRVRDEICAFGHEVNLDNGGLHISPEQLKHMYESNEDFVIIDARNAYEAQVGKFKDALVLDIDTFSEFGDAIKDLDSYKDKTVVMYCTGGIRCEKATAFMREHGFSNVKQLEGGIINYCNQFPDTYWQGSLFVFDDRLVADMGSGEAHGHCHGCSKKTDSIHNCMRIACDNFFVSCDDCYSRFEGCCSDGCAQDTHRRAEVKAPVLIREHVGKIENYYPKARAALVCLERSLSVGDSLSVLGKTTGRVDVQVNELRDYDGNVISHAEPGMRVTLLIDNLVRKNDELVVLV